MIWLTKIFRLGVQCDFNLHHAIVSTIYILNLKDVLLLLIVFESRTGIDGIIPKLVHCKAYPSSECGIYDYLFSTRSKAFFIFYKTTKALLISLFTNNYYGKKTFTCQ